MALLYASQQAEKWARLRIMYGSVYFDRSPSPGGSCHTMDSRLLAEVMHEEHEGIHWCPQLQPILIQAYDELHASSGLDTACSISPFHCQQRRRCKKTCGRSKELHGVAACLRGPGEAVKPICMHMLCMQRQHLTQLSRSITRSCSQSLCCLYLENTLSQPGRSRALPAAAHHRIAGAIPQPRQRPAESA